MSSLQAFSAVALLLLQRDYSMSMTSLPVKVLYLSACMMAYVVFVTYEATVTSKLTAR